MSAPEERSPFRQYARLLALPLFGALLVLGFLFWRDSGQVHLAGILASTGFIQVAGQNGTVAAVKVEVGDSVAAGQPLLRFGNIALLAALEKEQNEQDRLARMLPPEYIFFSDPESATGEKESLTQRLERLRTAEAGAVKKLQNATDVEARASVIHSRAALRPQADAARQQVRNAETELQAAREAVRKARLAQEAASRQRAVAETAVRRIFDHLSASGANRLSLQERVEAYTLQQRKVDELAHSLAASGILSPFDGLVQEIFVRPGDHVAAATPCFALQSASVSPTVNCTVEAGTSRKLQTGQRCLVSFSESVGPYQGYVAKIDPAQEPYLRTVVVALLRKGEENVPSGSVAKVTVLLRETPIRP